MTRSWEYPLFLIRHGAGFAAIVDPSADAEPTQALVVHQSESDSLSFMTACGISGMPTTLRNDREFVWLLESLRSPVVDVVFDPSPAAASTPSPNQRFSIEELLRDHLKADNSPWSYPVFVVAQETGFVSIVGSDAEGRELQAIGFFPTEERVQEYLEACGETGTPCAIANLDEARRFLSGIAAEVSAVAWNPDVVDGARVAKHCFEIERLLEKYLVERQPGADRD